MRDIFIKKTESLSNEEKIQFIEGFNSCFPKHRYTEESLFPKYYGNHFGYSYHAICVEDGRIIGSLSASPYWYDYRGKRIKVALTCDIFIIKEHRSDIKLFASLYKSLKEHCAKENVVCFFGVANENAYTYSIRILRCKELMTMDYWILPVRIGSMTKKNWLKPMNIISVGFSFISLGFNSLFSKMNNTKEEPSICQLHVDDDFLSKRLPDSKYTNCLENNVRFSYIITNDEDIRCAYIMYVAEQGKRSYRALIKCVSYILRKEKVDMIMFNGTLNLRQALLIKTPQRFEPRRLHVTVHYLTEEFEKQYPAIKETNGLDFTLLNLDVR